MRHDRSKESTIGGGSAAIFPEGFEERLDFAQIRAELLRLCDNEVSRHFVEKMTFTLDRTKLLETLARAKEMIALASSGVEIPVLRFGDLRAHIVSIRPEGAYLPTEGVYAVQQLLEAAVVVRRLFDRGHDEEELSQTARLYPHLAQVAEGIETLPEIRRRIGTLLDDEGNIRDTASKLLREIRAELHRLAGSIGATMQSLLKQAQAQGWVEQGAHATMREGRLLLPVIPSAKREVRGIVHDESATGRTLFIEPEQLVEMNNRIREKQSEEKREIVRILKEFTALLRPHISSIQLNCMLIGTLDFARAKSKLAARMQAVVPEISLKHPEMEWFSARHPLLERHLKAQNKSIVPLDIRFNSQQRIIVISGPNAGGKSASLKCVGLLQYMLQCGLPIPVADHSRCMLFDKIFLNLGDEQSLENDLSTYSSHLLNMKYFCRYATKKTLILIDEFGSGTEPIIGGAIAEALLKEFVSLGCYGMITTHYGNLKDFSEREAGVVNGAMLFDRQQIKPLYQLFIGKPGSSFAIEISRKIGLPEKILDYATQLVGTDYVMQDKYLQDIMRDKRYWEEKRAKIHKEEKELEVLKNKLHERLDKLNNDRKSIIAKAQQEALGIISNANADIEKTIREIKQHNAEKEATKSARKRLEGRKEKLQTALTPEQPAPDKSSKSTAASPKLVEGSRVTIEGSKEVGEIIEMLKGKARVRMGSLLIVIPLDKLTPTLKSATEIIKQKPKSIEARDDERRLNFRPQYDCRGMRVDEALQGVTYFIDDAIRYSYSPVRILHGTGTGALREAIRQQLHAHPMVRHYKDEHLDLGGPGITVVDLNL